MKHWIVFLGITALTLHCAMAQSHLQQLAWLEGTWERTGLSPDKTAFERWTQTDGRLIGIGWSMAGSDTTFVEKLEITERNGELFYIADVAHNAAPVAFKCTDISDTGFVVENPEHDFPKKIAYIRSGNTLTAVISAGEKSIRFAFRKMTH